MATIESGNTAFKGQVADTEAEEQERQSADVPQLPKAIRCSAQPMCDSARLGLGCEHAMSEQELRDWLSRLQAHRLVTETAPRRSSSASGPKGPPKPKGLAAVEED